MRNLAIALEAVGIIACISGITVECIMHAPIGYTAITGGAVIVATGALIWSKIIKKG